MFQKIHDTLNFQNLGMNVIKFSRKRNSIKTGKSINANWFDKSETLLYNFTTVIKMSKQ